MIIIDDRTGSGELQPRFPHGMSELGRLQFGDFAFWGRGEDETPWRVGIERKTIHDLVSCITTGRFAGHQLIGLLNTYNVVYVVVEGLFRPEPSTGVLETFKHRRWSTMSQGPRCFTYRAVLGFLTTLQSVCGVHVVRTGTDNETVHAVLGLYHWWSDKAWDEHRSHIRIYTPPRRNRCARFTKPVLVMKMLAQIDHVGWERAEAISKQFATVEELMSATAADLKTVPGVGGKLSVWIVNQLRGR